MEGKKEIKAGYGRLNSGGGVDGFVDSLLLEKDCTRQEVIFYANPHPYAYKAKFSIGYK